jgi:hypothetical protein
MKKVALFVFFSALSFAGFSQGRLDPCKIFGRIYIEKDRNYADFKVYVEETEAFAHLVVCKQANKFFADRQGQWYFTNDKREADFWIYIETEKGRSDFSIAYTNTESFAGCK